MNNLPEDIEQMAKYLGREDPAIQRLLAAVLRNPKMIEVVRNLLKRRCVRSGFIVHEYLLCQVEKCIGFVGPKWRLQRNSSVARDQGLQPDLMVMGPDSERIIVEICCSNLSYDAQNILIEAKVPGVDQFAVVNRHVARYRYLLWTWSDVMQDPQDPLRQQYPMDDPFLDPLERSIENPPGFHDPMAQPDELFMDDQARMLGALEASIVDVSPNNLPRDSSIPSAHDIGSEIAATDPTTPELGEQEQSLPLTIVSRARTACSSFRATRSVIRFESGWSYLRRFFSLTVILRLWPSISRIRTT